VGLVRPLENGFFVSFAYGAPLTRGMIYFKPLGP
jgi:hypothetical protein